MKKLFVLITTLIVASIGKVKYYGFTIIELLNIYPQPADNILYLSPGLSNFSSTSITLRDFSGKQLKPKLLMARVII